MDDTAVYKLEQISVLHTKVCIKLVSLISVLDKCLNIQREKVYNTVIYDTCKIYI